MADTDKLKQALNAYTGDADTLNQFVSVAEAELGNRWTETVYDVLTDLSEEERAKLDHAFQYYAATMAWNEAQSYLAQTEPLDESVLRDRIPILEHWLAFFQEAGLAVVEQLKQKAEGEPLVEETTKKTSQPIESIAEIEEEGQPVKSDQSVESTEHEPSDSQEERETLSGKEQPKSEALWLLDKVRHQVELTQDVQAWVAARCVALGQKEVFFYPHYGLVVDLMNQTKQEIEELLNKSDYLDEINRADPTAIRALQDYQVSLMHDVEIALQNGASAETTLIGDDLTGQDARRILGQLDTSTAPEFSGPAPDGFEVVLDELTELDEQPIKEGYSQIENVVLSEQAKNNEKSTSQKTQNGVKKKMSFSLGNRKPAGTE